MDADSDPRFSHVATDPRFKSIPRNARKVKIDARFRSMFTDKRFKVKYSVDKRGRKVKQTSNEDLRKYYQLEEEELPREARKAKKLKKRGGGGGGEDSLEEVPVNGAVLAARDSGDGLREGEPSSGGNAIDVSKGESPNDVADSSASSSSESENEDETSSTDIEDEFLLDKNAAQEWGEEGQDVLKGEETSHRLAVCNMDWDKISAQDLFVLLNSFRCQGGVVRSVSVYPSDFGRERMAQEEVEGPAELVGGASAEGSGYSQEKLRQYEWSRMKYYYAVVECDSKATAEYVYEQCDGLEYEHSGGKLDLRFIPDEMTFDDREPKSVATESLIPADFQPSDFFSSALQQSKVHLTWDETDLKRKQKTMRKFTKEELLSLDFTAYLASSSEEEGGGEGGEEGGGEGGGVENTSEADQIMKYRALLEDPLSEGEKEVEEMEITWEPGLRETAEDLVKKKKAEQGGQEMTPWEKYLQEKKQRRREKKRRRNKEETVEEEDREEVGVAEGDLGFDDPFFQHKVSATTHSKKSKKEKLSKADREKQQQEKDELELLVMEDDGGKEHFSLKGILQQERAGEKRQRKKRRKEEGTAPPVDDFRVDVQDPRFAALYDSHLFAPDPANPQYKATKGMEAIMTERQRRRRKGEGAGGRGVGPGKGERQAQGEDEQQQGGKETFTDPSITSLVKSVKSKATSFNEHRKALRAKRSKSHHL